MPLDHVKVGCDYLMQDGRTLHLNREWTAEDGHTRVGFAVLEGNSDGPRDCSKTDFLSAVISEVRSHV